MILACLEKEPTRRPQNAQVLALALAEAADGAHWGAAEAQRWWSERAPAVLSSRSARQAHAPQTIAVDLDARAF